MEPGTGRHFLYLTRGFVPKLDHCNVEVVPADRTHGMQAFKQGFEPLKGQLCIREGRARRSASLKMSVRPWLTLKRHEVDVMCCNIHLVHRENIQVLLTTNYSLIFI